MANDYAKRLSIGYKEVCTNFTSVHHLWFYIIFYKEVSVTNFYVILWQAEQLVSSSLAYLVEPASGREKPTTKFQQAKHCHPLNMQTDYYFKAFMAKI